MEDKDVNFNQNQKVIGQNPTTRDSQTAFKPNLKAYFYLPELDTLLCQNQMGDPVMERGVPNYIAFINTNKLFNGNVC